MTTRIGTSRRNSRSIMTVAKKDKGKLAIKNFVQSFSPNEQVLLKVAPSIHAGVYFRRFHGKVGIIISQTVKSCKVQIKDKGKIKIIDVGKIHLRRINGA